MTDTTETIDDAGFDRRRFIKRAAGGAALVWAAPTVMGLDTRALAAPGSDPDCIAFFTNFDEAGTGGLSINATIVPGLVVSQGNVDIIPLNTGQYNFIPGNGLYLDLDGTNSPGQPQIKVMPLDPDTYTVELVVAGSRRGDTNTATVAYGLTPLGLITENSGDGPTTVTYNNVIASGSDQLTITQTDLPDNQGLLILSIKIYSC